VKNVRYYNYENRTQGTLKTLKRKEYREKQNKLMPQQVKNLKSNSTYIIQ